MKLDFEKIENAITNEKQFKDMLGKTIQIKDVISFIKRGYDAFHIGVVTGFTPAGFRIYDLDLNKNVQQGYYGKNRFLIINNEAKYNEDIKSKIENIDFQHVKKNFVSRYFCLMQFKKYSEAEIVEKFKKENINSPDEQFNGILKFNWVEFKTDCKVESVKNALKKLVIENKNLSDWYLYTKNGFVTVSELTEKDKPVFCAYPHVFNKSLYYGNRQPADYYINSNNSNVIKSAFYDAYHKGYRMENVINRYSSYYKFDKQLINDVQEFCKKDEVNV